MLNNPTIFIANDLQQALDNKDTKKINEIMVQVYPDYDKSYVHGLIDYNFECDIKASDLLNFKYLHPLTPFNHLFCFQPYLVKVLCNCDSSLKWVGKS
jgi:hypothetical protein